MSDIRQVAYEKAMDRLKATVANGNLKPLPKPMEDGDMPEGGWLIGAVSELVSESTRRHEAGEFDPRVVAWLNDPERT